MVARTALGICIFRCRLGQRLGRMRRRLRWSGQRRLDTVGAYVFWCCWQDDGAAFLLLSGALILAVFVKVTRGGGDRCREILFDEGGDKAGPGHEG
jgi:hypothetical protein